MILGFRYIGWDEWMHSISVIQGSGGALHGMAWNAPRDTATKFRAKRLSLWALIPIRDDPVAKDRFLLSVFGGDHCRCCFDITVFQKQVLDFFPVRLVHHTLSQAFWKPGYKGDHGKAPQKVIH